MVVVVILAKGFSFGVAVQLQFGISVLYNVVNMWKKSKNNIRKNLF